MGRDKKMVMFFLIMSSLAMASIATIQDDEKECADRLTNLASCIPNVSGTANNPTPECCQDTQKLKASKPRCLCVLIKKGTDPSMGLPINTNLALQMHAAYNKDASVSNCPTLLNLLPDSPDAKIFKASGQGSSSSTTSTDSSSTSVSSSSGSTTSASSTSPDSKATTSSSGVTKRMSLGIESLLMMLASTSYGFNLLI